MGALPTGTGDGGMVPRFQKTFEIPEHDLQRLMNCIVEHARPDEARDVERLLGFLGSLSTRLDPASEGDVLTFAAPAGSAPLVERALRAMARSDRHHERALRHR